MIYDGRDRVRVRNTVLVLATLAWVLLLTRASRIPGLSDPHAHHHVTKLGAVSPSDALDWLLMLAAMMAPILIQPIQFVRGSTLARRRTRTTLLFVAGYTVVWMFVGALMLLLARAPGPSGFPAYVRVGAFFLIALTWQCSPAKQVCLNRCHVLSPLPAFGRTADTGTLVFGATQGVWCAGSCWAWMLLPLLLSSGHIVAMIATTFLILCERLDDPARVSWRWRGLGKAARIVAAQARILMPRYSSFIAGSQRHS
jgi:predicted metal-binding membrane protein